MNFESRLLGESSKKHAPLSPATALASSVFPVPVDDERVYFSSTIPAKLLDYFLRSNKSNINQ